MKFSASASLIFVTVIFLAACAAQSSDDAQVRAVIDQLEAAARRESGARRSGVQRFKVEFRRADGAWRVVRADRISR